MAPPDFQSSPLPAEGQKEQKSPETPKKASAPAAPAPSPYNRSSLPQGIWSLTAPPSFQPVLRTRNKDGKWVIRYYLFNNKDIARFKQENIFADPERESGMHVDSAKVFTAAQEEAAKLICKQIEGVCQVHFERVVAPAEADMHLFAADFGEGIGGRVRNYERGPTQVIVANRVFSKKNPARTLDYHKGSMGYGTLVHEMLHGMGLSHPKEESLYANGKNGTVMSNSGEGGALEEDNDLGRYDIAALQHLYGEPPSGGHPSGLPFAVSQPRSVPRCRR